MMDHGHSSRRLSAIIPGIAAALLIAFGGASRAQEYDLQTLLKKHQPLTDVTYSIKARTDTMSIQDSTSTVEWLDATHFRVRTSSRASLEVYSGKTKRTIERPGSESLTIADGTNVWTEKTGVDPKTNKVETVIQKNPVSTAPQVGYEAFIKGVPMLLGMFKPAFKRVEEYEGHKVAVFAGPSELPPGMPAMATMYFKDIEVKVDIENGFIHSFVIHGGGSGGYRLTMLSQVVQLKSNAGLKPESFTYSGKSNAEEIIKQRQEAVKAAAVKARKDAVDTLAKTPTAELPDESLRYDAVMALAERDDKAALDAIIHALPRIHDQRKDAALVRAMAKLSDPKAFDELMARAQKPKSASTAWAIDALADTGDKRAAELLSSFVLHPGGKHPMRYTAIRALAKMKHPAGIDALGDAVLERCSPTPEIAALALLEMNDPRATEKVIAGLNKADTYSGPAAAKAFAKTKNKAGVEALIKALDSQYGALRTEALRALGEIGDTRAVDPVITCLKPGINSIRRAAVDCLAKLDDPRALPALRKVAADDRNRTDVGRAANNAIKKLEALKDKAE